MDPLYELKQRARKDFESRNLKESEWTVFWIGYMSAVMRFGGK